jgi:hypothetical protein
MGRGRRRSTRSTPPHSRDSSNASSRRPSSCVRLTTRRPASCVPAERVACAIFLLSPFHFVPLPLLELLPAGLNDMSSRFTVFPLYQGQCMQSSKSSYVYVYTVRSGVSLAFGFIMICGVQSHTATSVLGDESMLVIGFHFVASDCGFLSTSAYRLTKSGSKHLDSTATSPLRIHPTQLEASRLCLMT